MLLPLSSTQTRRSEALQSLVLLARTLTQKRIANSTTASEAEQYLSEDKTLLRCEFCYNS
jgi:hypothetical protein